MPGARRVRWLRIVLLALVASALSPIAAPATARAAVTGPGDLPTACAWPFITTAATLNVAFPDQNASYWTMPFVYEPGYSMKVEGTYPAARYMSLITYYESGAAVAGLADYEIAPDAGSTNPFVDAGAGTDAATRRFTVTVDSAGPPVTAEARPPDVPNPTNTLASPGYPGDPNSGPSGVAFLIYRVYVPDTVPPTDDPNSPALRGSYDLPTITLTYPGVADPIVLEPCATVVPFDRLEQLLPDLPEIEPVRSAPPATFVLPAAGSNYFPNVDNKYIGATATYAAGRIVVIRGKAPTSPNTRPPGTDPPSTIDQVRYWSFCNNDDVLPLPVVACVLDHGTALDDQGYYTYVMAAPGDTPSNATSENHVTVVPWGSTDVNKALLIRNMLPAVSFPHSVQDAINAAAVTGASAETTMGEYYPRATYCATKVFERGGAAACFAPIPRFTG